MSLNNSNISEPNDISIDINLKDSNQLTNINYKYQKPKSQCQSFKSILKINTKDKKLNLNSPRTLFLIKQLGYNVKELEYQTFKEFLINNPSLINKSKKIQIKYYNLFENLRKSRINEIIYKRKDIQLQNQLFNERRSNSCYNVLQSGNINKNYGKRKILNEQNIFERLKNKNETDIINKIHYELKNEIIRKQNEKKIIDQNQKLHLFFLKQNEKRKEEEKMKKLKEEQEKMEERELEELIIMQKKQISKEEIKKAKEEEKKEKQKIKENLQIYEQKEKKKLEIQKKINKTERNAKKKILEKALKLKEKENRSKTQIDKKNKELKKIYMKRSLDEKENLENALINNEMKKEEILRNYLTKQHENEIQRKKYEILLAKQKKIIQKNALLKENEVKEILHRSEMIKQQKIDNYIRKQYEMKIKLKEREQKKEKKIQKERTEKKERSEQKTRDALNKNEMLLNQKKIRILSEIHLKENITQKMWNQKRKNEIKMHEENTEKRLQKQLKVKQTAEQFENLLIENRINLYQKNQKIEEFLKQKQIKNEKKKIKFEQISKQKEIYDEQFEKLFSKKTINNRTLKDIQSMFPDNPQLSEAINELKEQYKI